MERSRVMGREKFGNKQWCKFLYADQVLKTFKKVIINNYSIWEQYSGLWLAKWTLEYISENNEMYSNEYIHTLHCM